MIENAVYDDPHSARVNFLYELGKVRVAFFEVFMRGYPLYISGRIAVVMLPELHAVVQIILDYRDMRVDMVVVLCVVFMVGGRNEQRVEINCLDAQILQVVELCLNALQIAAVEAADVELVGQFIPFHNPLGVSARVIIFVVLYVIRGVAVAEAVGEYLVKYRTLRPFGNLEAGDERKIELGLHVFHTAQTVIRDALVVVENFEMIVYGFIGASERHRVEVESGSPLLRESGHNAL